MLLFLVNSFPLTTYNMLASTSRISVTGLLSFLVLLSVCPMYGHGLDPSVAAPFIEFASHINAILIGDVLKE